MHVTGPDGQAGHELLLETGDWSTLLSLETTRYKADARSDETLLTMLAEVHMLLGKHNIPPQHTNGRQPYEEMACNAAKTVSMHT